MLEGLTREILLQPIRHQPRDFATSRLQDLSTSELRNFELRNFNTSLTSPSSLPLGRLLFRRGHHFCSTGIYSGHLALCHGPHDL